MGASAEETKARVGNPFHIRERIHGAAQQGSGALTEDDLFLAKWYGLYTHRHEPGQFMLRLKLPGGRLNAAQLKVIARIASEWNRDFADLTTRQDIQLHWVRSEQVPQVLQELEGVGVTTQGACGDVLRNLVGCPVSGLDAHEWFDAGPILEEAHRLFTGNPDFANLPRKYKVSIAACRDQCPQPEIHCVSFVGMELPGEGQGRLGFDVRVGGGLSTRWFFAQRLNAFVPPERVVPTLKAITARYAAPTTRNGTPSISPVSASRTASSVSGLKTGMNCTGQLPTWMASPCGEYPRASQ